MVNIHKIKSKLLMISLFYFIGYSNIGNGGETMQAMDNEHLDNMQKNSS